MTLQWSGTSIARPQEIYDYLYDRSPQGAEPVFEAILASAERLADFPRLGRESPHYEREDVRELIVADHRVV
ncbi:MAG: hypothetical protein MAG453_00759 [Calditrichaeota bacterium]|nr:hypothetical protein [Calditrichota bacterium]